MSNASNDEKKLLALLNTKAAVDRDFRQLLIKNPREAIRQTSGVDVPERFSIRFVEKPKDVDALVVLPEFIDNAEALSPEELEAVAGGAAEGDCWVLSCVTSCGFTCGVVTCGWTGGAVEDAVG
jgi:hypothetical protein